MAEALGAAGSIAGIISFGLQLATTLQIYIETMLEAEERLRDITFDINSTASALRQLQDIIDEDKTGIDVGNFTPKVFKDEGRREIEAIAQKCGKVYRTIVLLVNKAGNLDSKKPVSTASSDVVPLKISSLTRMMKWPWVEPHIKRCQEQLRWLKMSLLFNLQLASLARLQLGTPDKARDEDELVIRKMIVFLRQNEIDAARALTRKPEKRQAVASSSSSTSSASAPIFSESLVSPSPPENIKPPENPMNKFSVKARSFNPGAEETSGISVMRNASPYAPGKVQTVNGFHQPENNTKNLRRITTRIPEEPEECPEANRTVSNEIPPEPKEVPKQEPEVFQPKNVSKQLVSQATSPPSTGEAASSRENGLALATSIQQTLSTVSGMSRIKRLPSWLKELFNPHGDSYDWESETLEAFVLLDDTSDIIKVPFGDKGLRRLKKRLGVSWDKYASLKFDQHQLVDKAILEAKLLDPRERICLGVGLYPRAEDDAIFVFFSLGDHVEPIHFTDFLGREFKFPFQFFRLWDKSNPEFIQLFQHMNEVGCYVSGGCYDILDEGGNILMPHTIKHSIEPGARLSMQIWAKPEIDHNLLIAEKEAIQKSKAAAVYLTMGEGETGGGKETLKLKDALGRMYTLPFGICKTWDGISKLINQAFLNINIYGPHVANGHYDLVGPDNCRILPQLWEETVQPGWLVLMCLWPKPEYPSNILPWHIIPIRSTPRRGLSSPPPPPPILGQCSIPVARSLGNPNFVPGARLGDHRTSVFESNARTEFPVIKSPRDILRERAIRESTEKNTITEESPRLRSAKPTWSAGRSVPVVPLTKVENSKLAPDFEMWGKEVKGASEDWNEDFNLDDEAARSEKIRRRLAIEVDPKRVMTGGIKPSTDLDIGGQTEPGMVGPPTMPVRKSAAYANKPQSAFIPLSATSQEQSPLALPQAEARDQIARSYSSGHAAESAAPEDKGKEGSPINPSAVRLEELFDECMPPSRMSPQISEDSWATDSIISIDSALALAQGIDEDCHDIRKRVNPGPKHGEDDEDSENVDLDIELDLDIDLNMEELSIGELLGRYTNATDTAIGIEEDHKVESSSKGSSKSW